MGALPGEQGQRKLTEADFWSRVDRGEPDACWPWTGCLKDRRQGYGTFQMDYVVDRTHRWAYRLTKGEIPPGLLVLHSCDNRLCCNPAHLRVGTHQDNMRDREERGRNRPRTRAGGSTKLTAEQADEIRERWVPGKRGNRGELAREFGISGTMVWKIGTGRA